MINVVVVGVTGWVGEALVPAILAAPDLSLVGAVARKSASRDIGEVLGLAPAKVKIVPKLQDALTTPSDVVVDYSHPDFVRQHVLEAVAAKRHVVVGTSGLGADDYAEIDKAAQANQVGVLAAGNFSITATLLKRFTLEAARYIPDVEIVDYASAGKPDTPSGTARELAETLSAVRQASTAAPVASLRGVRETRGAELGSGTQGGVQVHSLRLPSFVLSVEALFGADNERLVIRHDAGESAAPYVAGTLLAIRHAGDKIGLRRGLDSVLT